MYIRLLIGTNNQGKIAEYRALLADLPLVLATPREEGIDVEVEETGKSFRENAILKARVYAQASGLLSLADDSGLEVEALGGAPGVQSHRYGGEDLTDADRNRLLLEQMRDVPASQRGARFVCVVAIAQPDGRIWTREGVCSGQIGFEPRGSGGFGYDPVFLVPQLGRTMAELPPEIKNRISHRAQAMRNAKGLLMKLSTAATRGGEGTER